MIFRNILKIFLFIFLIRPLSAQGLNKPEDNVINLSRTRILFGYSSIIRQSEAPELKNIFLNLNYKWSSFDQFSKPLEIRGAFEIGFNGLNIIDKDFHGVAFVPYNKRRS